jgi:NADH-quinone oxidoreductase subunit C
MWRKWTDMALEKETSIERQLASELNIKGETRRERRVWASVSKDRLVKTCEWAEKHGFEHLSAISVVDWPEEKSYELVYHLWSYKDKVLLTLKTRIDRGNPTIDSVIHIWNKSAQIHEREIHELFGAIFEANEDLAPLFLEDWQGPPPFRKDFDWREYVRSEYYDRKNERERAYYD